MGLFGSDSAVSNKTELQEFNTSSANYGDDDSSQVITGGDANVFITDTDKDVALTSMLVTKEMAEKNSDTLSKTMGDASDTVRKALTKGLDFGENLVDKSFLFGDATMTFAERQLDKGRDLLKEALNEADERKDKITASAFGKIESAYKTANQLQEPINTNKFLLGVLITGSILFGAFLLKKRGL